MSCSQTFDAHKRKTMKQELNHTNKLCGSVKDQCCIYCILKNDNFYHNAMKLLWVN